MRERAIDRHHQGQSLLLKGNGNEAVASFAAGASVRDASGSSAVGSERGHGEVDGDAVDDVDVAFGVAVGVEEENGRVRS